jgi:hypothetical protein
MAYEDNDRIENNLTAMPGEYVNKRTGKPYTGPMHKHNGKAMVGSMHSSKPHDTLVKVSSAVSSESPIRPISKPSPIDIPRATPKPANDRVKVKPKFNRIQVQRAVLNQNTGQCLEVMREVNNKSGRNAISEKKLRDLCAKLKNM